MARLVLVEPIEGGPGGDPPCGLDRILMRYDDEGGSPIGPVADCCDHAGGQLVERFGGELEALRRRQICLEFTGSLSGQVLPHDAGPDAANSPLGEAGVDLDGEVVSLRDHLGSGDGAVKG